MVRRRTSIQPSTLPYYCCTWKRKITHIPSLSRCSLAGHLTYMNHQLYYTFILHRWCSSILSRLSSMSTFSIFFSYILTLLIIVRIFTWLIVFYSSLFLTIAMFLYDQPSERAQNKQLEEKTSLWWHVEWNSLYYDSQFSSSRSHFCSPAQLQSLVNPLYERNPNTLHLTVHPCSVVSLQNESLCEPSLAQQNRYPVFCSLL